MAEQVGLPGIGVSVTLPNPNAYAAPPGSGPMGESCASCRYLSAHISGNRRYHKCGLINWTRGKATDIRKRAPACRRWVVRRWR